MRVSAIDVDPFSNGQNTNIVLSACEAGVQVFRPMPNEKRWRNKRTRCPANSHKGRTLATVGARLLSLHRFHIATTQPTLRMPSSQTSYKIKRA